MALFLLFFHLPLFYFFLFELEIDATSTKRGRPSSEEETDHPLSKKTVPILVEDDDDDSLVPASPSSSDDAELAFLRIHEPTEDPSPRPSSDPSPVVGERAGASSEADHPSGAEQQKKEPPVLFNVTSSRPVGFGELVAILRSAMPPSASIEWLERTAVGFSVRTRFPADLRNARLPDFLLVREVRRTAAQSWAPFTVRGVPASVPIADIQEDLDRHLGGEGHVKRVARLHARTDGDLDTERPIPVISVTADPEVEERLKKWRLFDSLPLRVSARKFVDDGTPQCLRCFDWGHRTGSCGARRRCKACGDTSHSWAACPQRAEPATLQRCFACAGPHSVRWGGCPLKRREQERVRKVLQPRPLLPSRAVSSSFSFRDAVEGSDADATTFSRPSVGATDTATSVSSRPSASGQAATDTSACSGAVSTTDTVAATAFRPSVSGPCAASSGAAARALLPCAQVEVRNRFDVLSDFLPPSSDQPQRSSQEPVVDIQQRRRIQREVEKERAWIDAEARCLSNDIERIQRGAEVQKNPELLSALRAKKRRLQRLRRRQPEVVASQPVSVDLEEELLPPPPPSSGSSTAELLRKLFAVLRPVLLSLGVSEALVAALEGVLPVLVELLRCR